MRSARTGTRRQAARGATARATRHPGAFTLIEVIVVLAVLALLAGVLGPALTTEVPEGQRRRAEADLAAVAQALVSFRATTGSWPAMDRHGRRDRLTVLLSGTRIPPANPWLAPHELWLAARGQRGDLLANHLVGNSPQGQRVKVYPTAGRAPWCGPYLDTAALDPWGRPYVVNIVAGYSKDPHRDRRLWVLSAGADGRLQTAARAGTGDDVQGDDVGFLVQLR